MGFLAWHYSKGIDFYLNRFTYSLRAINHQFSFLTMLRTLFAPWKRLSATDDSPGFNLQKFMQTASFNFVSRIIGAGVRIILIMSGIIILGIVFMGGSLGFILWLAFPVVGMSSYNKFKSSPKFFAKDLAERLKDHPEQAVSVVFDNPAGNFVLEHMGLDLNKAVKSARVVDLSFTGFEPDSYGQVVEKLIDANVWDEDFYQKHKIVKQDFIYAAQWWDSENESIFQKDTDSFGYAGFGLNLLFGYTPTLDKYSSDLSAPREFAHRLIGREKLVNRMERTLNGGSSAILVGQPGVGKKTVVLEFAQRAATGQLGAKMSYRKVLEFDYNALLSESGDLNSKKNNLSSVLKEASAAGNTILMIRDIHRLTHPDVEGYDFTDILEENLERRDLKIIAISTPIDYERFIAPNARLNRYLKKLEVTPPTKEEAFKILIESARAWERRRPYVVQVPAIRHILEESDRYITQIPFPEKALELLEAAVNFEDQMGGRVIDIVDINNVLKEKTGISFASLTGEEKERLSKLEDIIHKRLIDQEAAVNLIAQSLRSRMVNVSDQDRPIGTFLFLGPTGVGKTETAKTLAEVYYGDEGNMLRFDMAEYAGSEGLERLIGSVKSNSPGVLATSIKNNPASLLLLDEFEKAPAQIFNIFLSLLDEGKFTDAFGNVIIGRHLFVIATSNAGAEYIRQLVSEGVKGEDLQKKVVNHVLEKGIFTPEFINRFDGVVVYEPLGREELIAISELMFKGLKKSLRAKNINLQVSPEAVVKLAQDGYEPEFGARPMRRIIDLNIGDLLGKAILEDRINEGDTVQLDAGDGIKQFKLQKIT